jgi:hypothetical protein
LSKAWNIKLDTTLKRPGFKQSPLKHGLYTRGVRDTRLLIGVYVDDLIVIGGCNKVISVTPRVMKTLMKVINK